MFHVSGSDKIPAVLFLVLAPAVWFSTGCTGESALDPVAPSIADLALESTAASHKPNQGGKDSGGGPRRATTADLDGGMVTTSSQLVKVFKDNRRELSVGDEGTFIAAVALDLTYDTFSVDLSRCRANPSDTPVERQLELLTKLRQAAGDQGLWMHVDKVSLGSVSNGHNISLFGSDKFNVGVTAHKLLPEAGAPTVVEGPADTFTFTGGGVQITDNSGHELEEAQLACPNLDTIVVTIHR